MADSPLAPAPATLRSFRDVHLGASIVVCGCGSSLNALTQPGHFITIGVNDVGRLFQPDYLVVVDPSERFKGDRFDYVRSSQAKYLFTQLDNLDVPHPKFVRFALGTKDGIDFSNPDVLHYNVVTPYVALCLAIHMGAANIGLIGVDFTNDHFFAPTGPHEWTPHVAAIDHQLGCVSRAALARGVRVFNLSPISRLTSLPRMPVETFTTLQARTTQPERTLSIVSYATTPVAGVPAALVRCINARTPHRARCVWATDSYGNGITFESDVAWTTSPMRAKVELEAADLVIVHNGKIADPHRAVIKQKPAIVMAHNYIWNVDRTLTEQGFPGVVVGQYQATLPEFARWRTVPNPLPIWEDGHTPAVKPDVVTIAYTPADRHDLYPTDHHLYWHSKGYTRTLAILDRLATRHDIRLEVLRDSLVSHAEALVMKRRAHIVIDECVTGSYHRNSLEGLAVGAVVINAVGLLPGVEEALRHCAGGAPDCPFVRADLDTLEGTLETLIALGPDILVMIGQQNRDWLERHWDFGTQWTRFWQPEVDQANTVAAERARLHPRAIRSRADIALSVVVVSLNEGEFLRRTLESLHATLPDDGEIIAVDDHSDDGSAAFLANPPDQVALVRPPQWLGSAKARNFGAQHARGRVIIFSDAHVAVPPNWATELTAALNDTDVGAAMAAIRVMRFPDDYDADTSLTSQEARGYGMRWLGANLNVSWLPRKSAQPFPVPLLGGAFLAMRRNLFAAIGGFDPGLDTWGSEDVELSLRLWLLGFRCLVVPQVDAAHHFRTNDRPYPVDWDSIIYNKLRLAAVHFSLARQERVHDAYRGHPAFPNALRRLETSDADSRRQLLSSLRRFDDQWFFEHFAEDQTDPLATTDTVRVVDKPAPVGRTDVGTAEDDRSVSTL